MEFPEAREELEKEGYILTDVQFLENVQYARRKAALSGKGEEYLPLLLPDVIREYFFRMALNQLSAMKM